MEDTRENAINDMVKEAEKLGANAIIGIRFSSSQIASGSSEIMVYGTAIKI
ncbi:heavy metal-binding domain-containing protein [Natranaerofaba carboxydovora]|uniref:heavy metal-binding domain-containing protein n=1 Tax=Natranaerofaba carboxydovora TaxID=2742683 RepID=UPI001F144709|nr:heavy metal-binding domain-containing protein [Natranaerofaba carboxydovora]